MSAQHPRAPYDAVAAAFERADPGTAWALDGTIDLDFDVFHPQGMAVTEERIYLSSVEVHEWPDSSTSIYRVDVDTLDVDRLFTVDDHVGAVVVDPERGRLVGLTWASRRCYEWTPGGELQDAWLSPEPTFTLQDGRYVAPRMMLCSGFADDIGGLTLVDLETRRVRHRLPITLRSASGRPMTRNPVHVEATPYAGGYRLTMYAAPDDGRGTRMYVHTAEVGR